MFGMNFGIGIAAVAIVNLLSVTNAATINVGNHGLLPNTPNQTIQVFVAGDDAVQGLNFYIQVADGGPDVGGVEIGPAITDVDILTGTIFAANNIGQDDPGSVPQLAARVTLTDTGTVSAGGLLATITLDTTGFTSGSWTLNLSDTLNGPSDFAGESIAITDGSIFIVPEPSCIGIVVGISSLLMRRRVKKYT